LDPDPDPHQNVMDPQHLTRLYPQTEDYKDRLWPLFLRTLDHDGNLVKLDVGGGALTPPFTPSTPHITPLPFSLYLPCVGLHKYHKITKMCTIYTLANSNN
jgi:hypothetical protein